MRDNTRAHGYTWALRRVKIKMIPDGGSIFIGVLQEYKYTLSWMKDSDSLTKFVLIINFLFQSRHWNKDGASKILNTIYFTLWMNLIRIETTSQDTAVQQKWCQSTQNIHNLHSSKRNCKTWNLLEGFTNQHISIYLNSKMKRYSDIGTYSVLDSTLLHSSPTSKVRSSLAE